MYIPRVYLYYYAVNMIIRFITFAIGPIITNIICYVSQYQIPIKFIAAITQILSKKPTLG